MTRVGHGRHNVVATGSNDGTKQVSKDAWNDDHSKSGMLGFTATDKTISSGALSPVDSLHIVRGEGAAADNLDYITYAASPDVADKDLVILLSGAETITVRHNQGSVPANSGAIILLSAASKTLSATVPLILQRIGNTFYEIALNSDIVNANISAAAAIALSKLAALTASRALVSDGSGVVSVSSVTSTELGHVSGVTSAIQTQIDSKQAAASAATLTGAQDLTNKGVNISRILGFTYANVTIATGALAGTSSAIAVDAEGAGTSDTLDTVTGFANGDIVILIAQASQVITVTHDVGGADSIHLRHKINILLSETVPLVLQRKGGEWYEVSGPEITKIALYVGKPADALAVNDNQANHFCDMAGKIIKVKGVVDTVSSSGTPTFAIRKNSTDVLSTNITIDANENSSETAATPAVIKSDGSEVVAKDDILRVDVDAIGTGSKGGIVYIWIENLSSE